MAIETGTRLRIGWDFMSYEPGEVFGSVAAWLPDQGRAVPACLVRLDHRLRTLGVLNPGDPPVEAISDLLVLVPRYTGQTWEQDTGTVHAGLCDDPVEGPFDSSKRWPMPWIASHAVYRVIT